jgi:hypothetical protein
MATFALYLDRNAWLASRMMAEHRGTLASAKAAAESSGAGIIQSAAGAWSRATGAWRLA